MTAPYYSMTTEKCTYLRLCAEFSPGNDFAYFYYLDNGEWCQLGQKFELFFKMDHFTGCRFGLSVFSTLQAGGYADFSDFRYNE